MRKECWVSVGDRLPLYGPHDPRFRPPYHEDFVAVIVNGRECKAVFSACFDYTQPEDEKRWPYKFAMTFDEPGVTAWRRCSEEEWEQLPHGYENRKEDKPCN